MHRALACALTITWIFRKNAEHLMCDLTTGWILESAQSLSVCTYHITWIWRHSMTALVSRELLIPQNERELGCPEGSGMLIGDPLCEGSNANSTSKELWRAENSFLRMRGNSDAQKGAACS